jgi:uncharacterized protein (TIGR00661 family)
MKILYGIQLSGNGHINRSMELIGRLKELGHEVEIIGSGGGYEIDIHMDFQHSGFQIKYKSGQVDCLKTLMASNPVRLYRDVASYSQKWDLVISDFEPISAWIAKTRKLKSISISNQNAILIKNTSVGLPKWFMKFFCPTDYRIGIDYLAIDGVFQPLIDFDITEFNTGSSFLVYLPYFNQDKVISQLAQFEDKFIFYSRSELTSIKNVEVKKIHKSHFQQDLKSSMGVITHCGFSTTSEALILKKKLWAIPVKGQPEQKLNAKSLKDLGVFCEKFNLSNFKIWQENYSVVDYCWKDPTNEIIKKIVYFYESF